jgi:hypothetical protein
MAERLLRLAVWLSLFKWTGRALLVALALIVFLFSGILVAELARGLSPGRALLEALIATLILIFTPIKWIATGRLPKIDF